MVHLRLGAPSISRPLRGEKWTPHVRPTVIATATEADEADEAEHCNSRLSCNVGVLAEAKAEAEQGRDDGFEIIVSICLSRRPSRFSSSRQRYLRGATGFSSGFR